VTGAAVAVARANRATTRATSLAVITHEAIKREVIKREVIKREVIRVVAQVASRGAKAAVGVVMAVMAVMIGGVAAGAIETAIAATHR
jgi:hypothetical protein